MQENKLNGKRKLKEKVGDTPYDGISFEFEGYSRILSSPISFTYKIKTLKKQVSIKFRNKVDACKSRDMQENKINGKRKLKEKVGDTPYDGISFEFEGYSRILSSPISFTYKIKTLKKQVSIKFRNKIDACKSRDMQENKTYEKRKLKEKVRDTPYYGISFEFEGYSPILSSPISFTYKIKTLKKQVSIKFRNKIDACKSRDMQENKTYEKRKLKEKVRDTPYYGISFEFEGYSPILSSPILSSPISFTYKIKTLKKQVSIKFRNKIDACKSRDMQENKTYEKRKLKEKVRDTPYYGISFEFEGYSPILSSPILSSPISFTYKIKTLKKQVSIKFRNKINACKSRDMQENKLNGKRKLKEKVGDTPYDGISFEFEGYSRILSSPISFTYKIKTLKKQVSIKFRNKVDACKSRDMQENKINGKRKLKEKVGDTPYDGISFEFEGYSRILSSPISFTYKIKTLKKQVSIKFRNKIDACKSRDMQENKTYEKRKLKEKVRDTPYYGISFEFEGYSPILSSPISFTYKIKTLKKQVSIKFRNKIDACKSRDMQENKTYEKRKLKEKVRDTPYYGISFEFEGYSPILSSPILSSPISFTYKIKTLKKQVSIKFRNKIDACKSRDMQENKTYEKRKLKEKVRDTPYYGISFEFEGYSPILSSPILSSPISFTYKIKTLKKQVSIKFRNKINACKSRDMQENKINGKRKLKEKVGDTPCYGISFEFEGYSPILSSPILSSPISFTYKIKTLKKQVSIKFRNKINACKSRDMQENKINLKRKLKEKVGDTPCYGISFEFEGYSPILSSPILSSPISFTYKIKTLKKQVSIKFRNKINACKSRDMQENKINLKRKLKEKVGDTPYDGISFEFEGYSPILSSPISFTYKIKTLKKQVSIKFRNKINACKSRDMQENKINLKRKLKEKVGDTPCYRISFEFEGYSRILALPCASNSLEHNEQ
ncbi:uncharacterized protein LOC127248260 isoform X3 [Andrographis paniculata]|uniref:uncharacterized protein LOC127248260 isoform X3 n=1 Tax=Andrographis paniculata TaxID=175694 RepID=UPI0021E90446|nr:uncharacterized protein LOC127248260 isoform X3 [Andrographis paniculata]